MNISEKQLQEVVYLRSRGMSMFNIAKHVGLSFIGIRNHFHRRVADGRVTSREWTDDEIGLLACAIKTFPKDDWAGYSKYIKTKTPYQCRARANLKTKFEPKHSRALKTMTWQKCAREFPEIPLSSWRSFAYREKLKHLKTTT